MENETLKNKVFRFSKIDKSKKTHILNKFEKNKSNNYENN